MESENQKLQSLAGMSGEHGEEGGGGYFDDSDREAAARSGARVMARLRDELDTLRREVSLQCDSLLNCN